MSPDHLSPILGWNLIFWLVLVITDLLINELFRESWAKKKKEEYSNLLYIKLFSEAEAFLLLFP